jgi:hypothetical protein
LPLPPKGQIFNNILFFKKFKSTMFQTFYRNMHRPPSAMSLEPSNRGFFLT